MQQKAQSPCKLGVIPNHLRAKGLLSNISVRLLYFLPIRLNSKRKMDSRHCCEAIWMDLKVWILPDEEPVVYIS